MRWRMILEIEKTVVEGAAAAGLAAVLDNPALFAGRKVGMVMSGGNIDMRLLSNVILRELAREGRILTLEVAIEDRPGALARVAAAGGRGRRQYPGSLPQPHDDGHFRQIRHPGHGGRGPRRRPCARKSASSAESGFLTRSAEPAAGSELPPVH